MHGVMAFVLLWGLFVFIGAPQANAVAVSGFAPLAHNVDPARAAGLRPGDVVVRADGAAVHSATTSRASSSTTPARRSPWWWSGPGATRPSW